MSSIARLLDANVNRAREAMRVMEDSARFALNDAPLSGDLKALRHEFRTALEALPPGWLEAHRDAAGDVGRTIATDSEMIRRGFFEVVVAAGKRLTEALRVIEETCKVVDSGLASRIESIRYRAYDFDQQLTRRLGSGRARQWKLCLLLTQALCRRPWREVLAAALEGGADCVQVREKELSDRDHLAHAREVIGVARPAGATIIVNDRADIALACEADGVHLGQDDLSAADVRRLAGRQLIVGVSAHDLDEARRAVESGADYCGVGTLFPTDTKQRQVSGPAYLRAFVQRFPRVPHLAIGGIGPASIGQVVEAGARGVAVSRAICAADDPRETCRQLRAALEGVTDAVV
jgi:thiamine-phosphate pyrophosphorylase